MNAITLSGKYNQAKVFTNMIDEESTRQIINLLNQPIFKSSTIRIMPDVHAGKGCVIGFTAQMKDFVIPDLVGVDIGCGMHTVNLGKVDINFKELDAYINAHIPAGYQVNQSIDSSIDKSFVDEVERLSDLTGSSLDRNLKSISSLGGGNHFIEIGADHLENKYLVIHSGSRNFGLQIAKYYQKEAEKQISGTENRQQQMINDTVQKLKEEGRQSEIEFAIQQIREESSLSSIPKEFAYLTGEKRDQYLRDSVVAVQFAALNREKIAERICSFLGVVPIESFPTTHNYVDKNGMVRKGAISAKKGEQVLIPINMRDGSLLAVGKGNENWNCSAPHGAGRLMSRGSAKEQIDMKTFREAMNGIYTSSVQESTLDEAPDAYKPLASITENIQETVEIKAQNEPLYNFKAH